MVRNRRDTGHACLLQSQLFTFRDFMRFATNPGPLVLVIAMHRSKRRVFFPSRSVSIDCCSKRGTYMSTSMAPSFGCVPENMTWPSDG
jgi:hypothetical protein